MRKWRQAIAIEFDIDATSSSIQVVIRQVVFGSCSLGLPRPHETRMFLECESAVGYAVGW